jgi:hypothetical protein
MKRTQSMLYVALVALCCILVGCQAKKNRDAPHLNSGILPAYEAGPFGQLNLSNADESRLESGKPVMKQKEGKDGEQGGGAICVQDVAAPKEAVWSQILDLDGYKGKVPKVNECKNYVVRENNDGTCTVKTKMVLGIIPGYSVRSICMNIRHWFFSLPYIRFFSTPRFMIIPIIPRVTP